MPEITNQQLLTAMTQQLSVISDTMVTKDDLKEFHTDLNHLVVRFDGLETRFDGLEVKFENLEHQFIGLGVKFENLEHQFTGLGVRFEDLDHKFDTALNAIDKHLKLKTSVNRQGNRITRLETDNKLNKLAIKQLSSR
jgi:predicted nuclease with TOPRIM domain